MGVPRGNGPTDDDSGIGLSQPASQFFLTAAGGSSSARESVTRLITKSLYVGGKYPNLARQTDLCPNHNPMRADSVTFRG